MKGITPTANFHSCWPLCRLPASLMFASEGPPPWPLDSSVVALILCLQHTVFSLHRHLLMVLQHKAQFQEKMLEKGLPTLARDFFRLVHAPFPTAMYIQALSSFSDPRSSVQSKCNNNSNTDNKTVNKHSILKRCTVVCLLPGSSQVSFWVTRKLMVWVCITKSTQTTFSFEPKMDSSSVKTKLRGKQNSATISESQSTCMGDWLIIQVVFTSRLLCLCLLGVLANWQSKNINK